MRQDNKIQVRLVSVSEVKFMLNLDEALLANQNRMDLILVLRTQFR